jgi:hypothetical protein
METGVTAGVDWGLVSAEVNASAGIQIGSSSTTTASRKVTVVPGHTVRFFGYAAYQKRLYNVTQGSNTRQVVVWVPTGSVAIDWTEVTEKENCACDQGGRGPGCPFPEDDPFFCSPSSNPELPGEGESCPTLTGLGLASMVLLLFCGGIRIIRRRAIRAAIV